MATPMRIAVIVVLVTGCGGSTDRSSADASAAGVDSGGTSPPTTLTSDGGPPDATSDDGASACTPVLAADYDQTCTTDDDCVAVGQVSACPAQACDGCLLEAVNKDDATRYQAALTAAFEASPESGFCGCPCESGHGLCRAGRCQAQFCGAPRQDTLAACAQEGGLCDYRNNTTCAVDGPAGSCAYDDEKCCLPSPAP